MLTTMNTNPTEVSVKPRVLIADDSRIVRATLIKRIEGIFEFREALDGEQAWEMLLIDPNIRVVITDLTMPKLDGYGLLQRIRASKISRIRNLPVVVVSGSDEGEERERAKAAGATDLITKGIGTAQLLSRLDILSKLVNTQNEFERSLEALVQLAPAESNVALASPEQFNLTAEAMLSASAKHRKNFVLLNICVGLKHTGLEGSPAAPPASVVNALGQLLQRTVRQTDCVGRAGTAELTVATGSIRVDSARNFAQRLCNAVSNASLVKDDRIIFLASCGMVSWPETEDEGFVNQPQFADLRAIAHRRAMLGLEHALSGVVGIEEENAFNLGASTVEAIGAYSALATLPLNQEAESSPDLAKLLQWTKEGRQDLVMRHIDKLSSELLPLVNLMRQHGIL